MPTMRTLAASAHLRPSAKRVEISFALIAQQVKARKTRIEARLQPEFVNKKSAGNSLQELADDSQQEILKILG